MAPMGSGAEVDAVTRTFQAELRAVEEGHRARRREPDDPTVYLVTSDTRPGDWTYTVHVDFGYVPRDERDERGALAAAPTFSCDHLAVQGITHAMARSVGPGLAPCKHAAVVARRLEREGLIRWDEYLAWVESPERSLAVTLRAPRRSTVTDADLFDF